MEKVSNFVSILVPCRNEEAFIKSVLDDIINQDYPSDLMELLVIDGMSEDSTAKIVLEYQKENPFVKLISNPEKIVPTALNRGIKQSVGSVIVRLDAHCRYPTNYISYLVSNLVNLDAANVGVAVESKAKSGKLKAKAIAAVMGSAFGIGNSDFRTGVKKIQETDTVPFGCFKRSVFDDVGLFDEDLIRNQDDEFNSRLIRNGYKIYILPDLELTYFTRDTISQLAHMFYFYGFFKPLVNKKVGAPATIRQFVPPLFVLGNIIAVIALLIFPYLGVILTAGIWIPYLLVCTIVSLKIASDNKKPAMFFLLPLIFISVHFAYGVGYLKGFLLFQILRKSVGFKDISTKR